MKPPILVLVLAILASASGIAQTQSLFQRGLLALQQNHPSEALEALTAAEQQNPRDAAIRNFRGIALAELRRNDEATEEYREAIRLDPRMVDAYRNLGHLEWTAGRPDPARVALTKALDLSPTDPYAHYYLARIELDAKNDAAAAIHLDKSKSVWPLDAEFDLQAAAAYAKLHRLGDARSVLASLPQSGVTDAESVRFGALRIACQQPAEGVAVFQDLNSRRPNSEWAQYDLALADLDAHWDREAESVANSIPTSERTAELWTVIAIAQTEMQRHDKAIKSFRHATEIAPQDESAWLNLTRELMERLQYVDAVQAAERASSQLPRSYALRLRLGAAYTKAARYPEAEQVFRDLISKGDPEPTSAIGLAQVLMLEGRAEDAVEILGEAQKRLGPNFLLAYFRGIMLGRTAKSDEAVEQLRQAVALNPQSAEARQWLGKAELRAMRIDRAIVDLNEALRLDPGNQPARRLLAQAYGIRKQPAQAEKYLQQIKPGEIPKTVGDESADFLFPAWKFPPARP